jgi:hypothetical protein
VALTDPRAAVKRVRIAYEVPGENGRIEEVEFTLESEASLDELGGLGPGRRRDRGPRSLASVPFPRAARFR